MHLMQSLHELRKRILELAEPIEAIEVPLSEAAGLVLAEPQYADVDLPAFDRSTLAGYALRSADATPGRSLRIMESVKPAPVEPAAATSTFSSSSTSSSSSRTSRPPETGDDRHDFEFGFGSDLDFDGFPDFENHDDEDEPIHLYSPFDDFAEAEHEADESVPDFFGKAPSSLEEARHDIDFGIEVGPDEAVWVEAGDPMPIGADAVVAREDLREEPGIDGGPPRVIELVHSVDSGRNVLPRGQLLRAGTKLHNAGTRLRPSMIGLFASQGCIHPVCHRRVRIAVLAVGDQLVSPGEAPILHRERNATGLTVTVPCIQWGAMVHDLGTVSYAELDRALYRATTAPIVLVLAPPSEALTAAFALAGFEPRVPDIAIDPCENPTYGVIRNDSGGIESHVFRLSPRPIPAIAALTMFVAPLVARLQGKVQNEPIRSHRAVWLGTHEPTGDRAQAVPVKLEGDENARILARPVPYRGADDLAGFAQADALALLPANSGPWLGGEIVDVEPLGLDPFSSF